MLRHNFSALTCESCRSFFRRTAHKAQEWILSEEERRQRLERQKRRKTDEPLDSTSDSSSDDRLAMRRYSQWIVARRRVGEVPALVRDVIFSFNDMEINGFRELFGSTALMRDPVLKITTETNTLMDALIVLQKRCDIKCRRIIKMSTTLSKFTTLCEEDKICLVKAACPEIICLISVINFHFNGEFWTVAIDDENATILPLDVFRNVDQTLYEGHRNFLYAISEGYDCDVNIIDLLIAISLFNPNRPDLMHKDIIKSQQQLYIHLLRRYLELKYNSMSETERRFGVLMNNLRQLYAVNRLCVNTFHTAEPKEAGPLVDEIFDINQLIHYFLLRFWEIKKISFVEITGKNFGAVTCESCRSFFRRTAPKAQEWILSGEERQKRKDKKRRLNGTESLVDSTTDSVNSCNCGNSCADEQTVARRREVEVPSLVRDMIFAFNDMEINHFRELFSSTSVMRDPAVEVTSETTGFRDVLKCRRIVKMSKTLSKFTTLCESDKVSLVKAACPEIMCLISIINFNFDGEYWTVAIDDKTATTLKLDMFKYVGGNLYEAHRKFLRSLNTGYNSDVNLIAIILFNPKIPNLSQSENVKAEQKFYMYLLQRYLELKHSSKTESETRFVGLMNNLQELYAVNRIHVDKFIESEPKEAGPLVNEIYDIN
ncbi:unnamed protein product [Medioppia subpectinata]|uniref:NR LBD domain-containing protein n=1 Tax=Medioppia subpectinata TaxID=1979941 RepID=A0A7R9PZH7_9ACAR|nr:unnamed protein product [Medioppia subpectinata]CAG2107001.1 unnamed protein product [Medioppia subpectinata]